MKQYMLFIATTISLIVGQTATARDHDDVAACPEGAKNNYKGECVPTAESASTNSSKSLSPKMQEKLDELLEESPYEELTNDVLNPDRGFYRPFGGQWGMLSQPNFLKAT